MAWDEDRRDEAADKSWGRRALPEKSEVLSCLFASTQCNVTIPNGSDCVLYTQRYTI